MNTKSRFFLSRESKEWLDSIDGKLLSSIYTTNDLDMPPDDLFTELIVSHISAADFN